MKKIIVCLLICCTYWVQAQKVPLYFIVAHPFDSGGDKEFTAWYVKLEKKGDTLQKIKRLSTPDYEWDFVKSYTDQGFAVMERFHKKTNVKIFTCIDLKDPEHPKDLNIGMPYASQSLNPSVLISDGKDKYKYLLNFNGSTNEKTDLVNKYYINIKLPSLLTVPGFVEQFNDAIFIGEPGSVLDLMEGISSIYDSVNNVLKLPLTYDFSKRPIFPVELPKEKYKGIKRSGIEISNENFVILNLTNIHHDITPKFEISTYLNSLVINRKNKTYFEFKFKGNQTRIRNFGKWITGVVVELTIDENNKYYEWVSPGKSERRQATTKTGLPFDLRCYKEQQYFPGILFILNTETQQYIEWDTKQGDSEILLIEDDLITYRVNDKILQRTIKEKVLGEPKLILQHEFVPDIHWAFTAKNS